MQVARGDYLCLLDDDDVYYPDKVMRQLDYLKTHPDVDMVFSQLLRDDGQGGLSISPPDDYQFHPLTNFRVPNKIHNNSTLFRRRVLDAVRFDERLTKYQDWQFNMAISLLFKVEYLPICVGVWNRDDRSDRLALQDELTKFRNFRIICEIFADVIDSNAELRQRYYRRLGYLALKTNHWRCARASFNKIDTWRRWPAFGVALLKQGGSAINVGAKRCCASLYGERHA
jgi:glycosyltransferase involved in cell wall biosynthesis